MADKNRYDVKIGNNNYVLKTKRSKEETDAIVKYVDTELESAKEQLKYRNPAMHATLACLNIADTLYSISHEYDELRKNSYLPMKEYAPLKEKYDDMLTREHNSDQKISTLEQRISLLQNQVEELLKERDGLKKELDKEHEDMTKYTDRIQFLKNKLIEQEKETLIAYKQLQEANRRSGNK